MWRNATVFAGSFLVASLLRLHAQSVGEMGLPPGTQPTYTGPKIGSDASDYLRTADPDFRHHMLVVRREEMKRRMVQNAAHLLELSKQLDADLNSHDLTANDAKRLDEIAKLARAVRDQMKQ